jgi:hypothetical protein
MLHETPWKKDDGTPGIASPRALLRNGSELLRPIQRILPITLDNYVHATGPVAGEV